MAPSFKESDIINQEDLECPSTGSTTTNVPLEEREMFKTEIPAMCSTSSSAEPNPPPSQEPQFVKLNTAEKRRFKKALAEGLTRKEALERAKNPTEKRYPAKRNLSSSPASPSHVAVKRSRIDESSSVNMGLVPLDLFENPFDHHDLDRLQEAIIDAAIETGCEIKPQFEGCHPRRGWLMVSCSNANTAEWLETNVDIIKTKSGLELRIIPESDFPCNYFVHAKFPNSQGLPNDKILGTIEAQNQLKATTWRVLQRKWSEGSNVELSLAIDKKSWQKLKELKGHIAYRFGHIYLKMQQQQPQQQCEEKASKAVARLREFDLDQPSTSQEARYRNFAWSYFYNQQQARNSLPAVPQNFTSPPPMQSMSLPPPPMPLFSFSISNNLSWQGDTSRRFSTNEHSRRTPAPATNTNYVRLPHRQSDDKSSYDPTRNQHGRR
ncbi:uncharacterized protein [Musca autumnalis]|uniref:uncharacterized protein n=1 Tax=Musca autumnalis TaxID=221902 RepID=UPI003CF297E9